MVRPESTPQMPPFEIPPLKDYSPGALDRFFGEILAQFDKDVAAARAALEKVSDADMMANWSLLAGGQNILTMPRVAVLRGMVMNHLIHHRGQLTVYFRMLDVPVPGLYGPSADEGQMGKPANA